MKKTEIKGRKIVRNVSKKSLKSDNLRSSETSSILNSNDRNLKRSTISSNSKRSMITGSTKLNNRKSSLPKIPKDAAVHFGNFYGLQGNTSGRNGDASRIERNNVDLKSSPKSEFTRQMVHKLERSAGTEDYARQVSALLEDTVEPANFRVNPLPSENSIPDGRQNPTGYPLWYKDPYKMPITAKREYQLLKAKYKDINTKVQSETFVEESLSSENESDDENRDESEEEIEKNTKDYLKNSSTDDSSSLDQSTDENSISYEPSDDEDTSSVSSENEENNEDYKIVDTVLPVR